MKGSLIHSEINQYGVNYVMHHYTWPPQFFGSVTKLILNPINFRIFSWIVYLPKLVVFIYNSTFKNISNHVQKFTKKNFRKSNIWLFWWDPCCFIILVFCVVLLCVFTFWVPCCDVRYDFCIKTMLGSSLPPVVCRRAHVIFTLFVFACI